jgi:large subunit GTPase 1
MIFLPLFFLFVSFFFFFFFFFSPCQVRHEPTPEQLQEQKELYNSLRVPRRPRWTRDMDPEELHQKERDAFLDWRRNLSQVEARDNISMTPFEKNLNVWRQLWRVVEMSGWC